MINGKFENVKEFFLIISLDLKMKNKYSFLSLEKKLAIKSDEYKNSSAKIEKGFFLKNEDNYIIELKWHSDLNEAYFYLKNEIKNSEYII